MIRFVAADVLPTEVDVLRRMGIPSYAPVTPAVRKLVNTAAAQWIKLAEPRGVLRDVSSEEFALIYRGEGRNAVATPLQTIYPRADALALFAGTIGERVEQEIQKYCGAGDPALAFVLDTFASEATNRLADRLASAFNGHARVLPYSAGYCGWHVSGQRALFTAIDPSDIGIALNESCLMKPIKSVSGMLVAGDAATHQFRPAFPFCEDCATHECVARMISVR